MTLPRLMLVTDGGLLDGDAGDRAAVAAARSGVPLVIQVRDRGREARSREAFASRLRHELGTPSILSINGDADLARRVRAGLHLPAAAPSPAEPSRPFGRSVHDVEELARARDDGCDYAVAGPVFETTSKPGARLLGLDGFSRLVRDAGLPVFAIGGIDETRVRDVLAAGAFGVAVRSAILLADDPGAVVRALATALAVAAPRALGVPES